MCGPSHPTSVERVGDNRSFVSLVTIKNSFFCGENKTPEKKNMAWLLAVLVALAWHVNATTCSIPKENLNQIAYCYSFTTDAEVLGCFHCNQLCASSNSTGIAVQANCFLSARQLLLLVSDRKCYLGSNVCNAELGPLFTATCARMQAHVNELVCPPPIAIATIGGLAFAGGLGCVFLLTALIQRKCCKTYPINATPVADFKSHGKNKPAKRQSVVLTPAKKQSITNRMRMQSGRPSQTAKTMQLMDDMKRRSERKNMPPPLPTLPPITAGGFHSANLPSGPPPPHAAPQASSNRRKPSIWNRFRDIPTPVEVEDLEIDFPESADSLQRAEQKRQKMKKKNNKY